MDKFRSIVTPHFHESMLYKLADYKDQSPSLINDELINTPCPTYS